MYNILVSVIHKKVGVSKCGMAISECGINKKTDERVIG
jgi:hypothetical protein